MPSKLDIISNALLLIGDEPLNSLSDDRDAAVVASNIYDTAYESMLTAYPWRFAMGKKQLSQLVNDPLNEWRHAYQIPADSLMVYRTYPNSNYEIYEDNLYSDQSTVEIDYLFKPPESELPSYFVEAFQFKLASQFAISVTENRTLKEVMDSEYRVALIRAEFTDAQSRPNRPIEDAPFIDVRGYGRAGR